ncbi:MAG: hypothetical protein V1893_03690 [Candidatus Omnitrophota bacterium]
MNTQTLKIVKVVLAAVLVLCLAETVQAQEEKAKAEKRKGAIEGEISAISNKYISIVYKKEKDAEYEMLLPIDKDIEIIHKKSLDEMKVGDTVYIEYEDEVITDTAEEGQAMKRKAKVISFMSPAPPKPPEPQEEP